MGKGIVTAIGAQVGQSTPGTQALYRVGLPRMASRRKRLSTSRRKVKARAPTRRKRAGKARLVKGSRAAKAYMAKIRRKRRK
jgi:hypothetical protein